MRRWTIAMAWAAAIAAVLAWLDPEARSLAEFAANTAALAPPIWLAVELEERAAGNCPITRLWS